MHVLYHFLRVVKELERHLNDAISHKVEPCHGSLQVFLASNNFCQVGSLKGLL